MTGRQDSHTHNRDDNDIAAGMTDTAADTAALTPPTPFQQQECPWRQPLPGDSLTTVCFNQLCSDLFDVIPHFTKLRFRIKAFIFYLCVYVHV